MKNWTELPRLGFDTETTGVDSKNDRLVTCSVVLVEPDGATTRHYWLADPEVEIPESAERVHGISTEKARAEGRDITEVLEEVASLLGAHMARGFPVVAFNAGYDLTLLESELARHGLRTLAERLGGTVFPVVDPYYLDRWIDRYRKGKRRLENLVEFYGCAPTENFHNAEEDVLATLRVLQAMIDSPYVAAKLAARQRFRPGFPGGLEALSLEQLQAGAADAHANMAQWFNQKAIERGEEPRESLTWPVS